MKWPETPILSLGDTGFGSRSPGACVTLHAYPHYREGVVTVVVTSSSDAFPRDPTDRIE